MPSVLFVFLSWGYWALRYENQAPLSACVAALFVLAFLGEFLMLWLGFQTALVACLLTTLLYWCAGAVLRHHILSSKRHRYPKLTL